MSNVESQLFSDQKTLLSQEAANLRAISSDLNRETRRFKNVSHAMRHHFEKLSKTFETNQFFPKGLSEEFIRYLEKYPKYNRNKYVDPINALIKKEQKIMSAIGQMLGIKPRYNKKIYGQSQLPDLLNGARDKEYELKKTQIEIEPYDNTFGWDTLGDSIITGDHKVVGRGSPIQLYKNGQPFIKIERSYWNLSASKSNWCTFSNGIIFEDQELIPREVCGTKNRYSFSIYTLSKDKTQIDNKTKIPIGEHYRFKGKNIEQWKGGINGEIIFGLYSSNEHQDGSVDYRQEIVKIDPKNPNKHVSLYKGPYDRFEPHPEGILITRGDTLLLVKKENNRFIETIIYQNEKKCVFQFKYHPDGILIRVGDEILLNGKEKILDIKAGRDSQVAWRPVGNGIITEEKGVFTLNSFKKR